MRAFLLLLVVLSLPLTARAQQLRPYRGPIIDVHLHGGPGRADRVPPGRSPDSAYVAAAVREMDRYGVVLALTSMRLPERLAALWRDAAPGRIVVGPHLTWDTPWPDTASVRRELASGGMGFIGELGYVYLGLPPTDPRVETFFALAHRFDVPVGAHIGRRSRETLPPGCCPDFDDDYGDPALLRPILDRYPGLRLYLMHVGGDHYIDETIALMHDYPNVYGDPSVIAIRARPEVFHRNVRRLAEAGLLDRLMFGSDGVEFIGEHVEAFEKLSLLTDEQRRALFHDNAARFLRLSEEQIAEHHGE